MRDPERIDVLMQLLTQTWKSLGTDLRFFQFLTALKNDYISKTGNFLDGDVFYLEDDEFIKFLKAEFGK
jgi:hypothetical protein